MQAPSPPFQDRDVEAAFQAFPTAARPGLEALRALIFATASETDGVGPLTETLKWGQPAYLTEATGAGSTLRLGAPKQGGYAIYVHCQTTIIAEFRDMFGDKFAYDGNRALLVGADETPDQGALRVLIRRALTYHLAKRRGPRGRERANHVRL